MYDQDTAKKEKNTNIVNLINVTNASNVANVSANIPTYTYCTIDNENWLKICKGLSGPSYSS